jgi:hypothetical protein
LDDNFKPPQIAALDMVCAEHQRLVASRKDIKDKEENSLGKIESLMNQHMITAYRCGPCEYILNESRRLQVLKAKG